MIRRSSAGAMPGTCCDGATGATVRCWVSTCAGSSAVNGGRPVTSS